MSKKDISTMYTKELNKKTGRRGYVGWKSEKENSITPSEYGSYILQNRKRDRKKND